MKNKLNELTNLAQTIMPKTYVVALIISILTTATLVVIETQSLFVEKSNLPISKGQLVISKGESVTKSKTQVFPIENSIEINTYTSNQTHRINYEVFSSEVNQAIQLNLNHLVLGRFLGEVTVRYGKKVVFKNRFSKSLRPVIVSLSAVPSTEQPVISFDLEVRPISKTLGVSYELNSDSYFGFLSSQRLTDITRAQTFINEIYPFILSLVSLLLGLVFYFIYRLQPSWKDSLTISGFFWIASLIASLQTTTLFDILNDETWTRSLLILKFFEAFAILSLALRFARHNKPWISLMNLMAFVIGIFYGLILPIEEIHDHIFRISKYVIPLFLFVSSILLFYRGYEIDHLASESKRLGLRQDRLFTFGTTFLVTSIVTIFFAANYELFPYKTQLNQSFYLILGVIYCRIIYSELKSTAIGKSLRQFNRTATEEDFGEAVAGWIYMIDLKKSEILFRRGANFGQGGQLVLTCISQIWSIITQHGGTVMQCEGDSILAIFKNPDQQNLKFFTSLTETISRNIDIYKDDMIKRSVFIDGDELKLRFRSSLAKGEVQAVMREVEGESYTDWVEHGNSNPFVECGRLIDSDKSFGHKFSERSTLIISETIVSAQIESAKPLGFEVFLQPFTTKSGQKINITIYSPKSPSPQRGQEQIGPESNP